MEYSVNHANGNTIPVRNIYCVIQNFSSHAEEMGNSVTQEPIFFQKALTSLSTKSAIDFLPKGEIHHELELVVLISNYGYQILSSEVWKYITGFALGLDLTDRSLQYELKFKSQPWFLAKSFKGSAIVTDFHAPNLEMWSKSFWLRKNGVVVQKGNLTDMIFDIPYLVERLSARIPLLGGDIIFTGTPEGVGTLNPGDLLELGLGEKVLKNIRVI